MSATAARGNLATAPVSAAFYAALAMSGLLRVSAVPFLAVQPLYEAFAADSVTTCGDASAEVAQALRRYRGRVIVLGETHGTREVPALVADWIGSDTRFFKFVEPRRADYDTNAHRIAEQALVGMGLDARFSAPGDAPEFDQLTEFAKPNPAQAAVGSVGPETKLVILESETGSGKTEAALWRFTHLLAAGKVSAMYFAVPTRAAARQLHGRVQKAMDRVFGASAPEVVLAIPGILKAGDHEGQRLPHWHPTGR